MSQANGSYDLACDLPTAMCGLSKNNSELEHSFSALLEFAADNNVEGFKHQLSLVPCINQMGLWYRRQRFVRRMVVEQRTPLMVASIYGSVDVVKLILSFPEAELNLASGSDKSTALHCAASGASANSLGVVKLLLSAGADPNILDAHGNRPVDVLVASPHAPDPRKFHYTCVPCPDFKKGSCKQGDACEYAHGVFECWLHPAQYRTRLCKDGTSCNRRVCFFAHLKEELRPLYASTGSGLPSPSSAAATMDMASVLNMLPGSPSAAPISPSATMGWPQQNNIPALHLPGSNVQLSRLRSSLNARDIIPSEQLSMMQEFEMQRMSSPRFMNHHSARPKTLLTPSNLEELFSAEVASSPRFSDQLGVSSVLSPSHKSALLNQLQSNKQQSMLSPIKTNIMSSPKNVEHHSPRAMEPISPMNSRMKQQLHPRSLSSRDFGSSMMPTDSGSPLSPWSSWDQNHGNKVDWSVQSDELGRLRKSHSLANNNNSNREADVTWVQQLVKDSAASPRNNNGAMNMNGSRPLVHGGSSVNPPHSESDILDAWLEQLQLDR
ncbi:hypothetical protein HID58_089255 [Brassica napus]|uniref:C3H1-type domain-containing protein n=1 Tax=Brassica napus TaxID=3708 RepID=A0ABQ7XYI0_BRANA|nr:hypothetical protein HID58_089255 [Brassica napus]